MGGCYSDSYYTARSVPVEAICPEDKIPALVDSFFGSGDKTKLVEAYKQFLLGSQSKRFIRYLLENAGIDAGINEFPGIEIESKLEVMLVPKNKSKKSSEPTLSQIMDLAEFPPSPSARFLKDACNNESSGVNHFFGTDDEERFVVIEKGGKTYLKEKGTNQPYNFGMRGEQYVLRRPETREETNPLVVAQTVVGKYGDGKTKYHGAIEKHKIEAFLINSENGRLYSMVVSDSLKDQRRQMQLEVEYAGYVPGFRGFNEGDEREVVGDILYIDKMIFGLYNGLSVGDYRVNFIPTTESKFEFASGKDKPSGDLIKFPLDAQLLLDVGK